MKNALPVLPKRWWLPPLLWTLAIVAVMVMACIVSEIAREVLAKSFMLIAGAMATPFVLETSIFLIGIVVVVVVNQYRLLRDESDEWVYLAQTTPDSESLAAGAETPPHRLDAVVLRARPEAGTDHATRVAMVEGFLELGLKKEALEHLDQFSAEERATARVKSLYAAAER